MQTLRVENASKQWKLQSGEKLLVREMRCNKGACKQCPHAFYAYATKGFGKARKHRYLGTCTKEGFPRQKYTDVRLPLNK